MLTTQDTAKFTWGWGHQFFLETEKGNFVWSDPDYIGGDNTIRPFEGGYNDWLVRVGIPFGRCKGEHVIGEYCGIEVEIVEE